MTPENAAQKVADAMSALENAAENLTVAIKSAADVIQVGPVTRRAMIRWAQGIEGDIAQLHLDLSQLDPRPRPMDGGGGK